MPTIALNPHKYRTIRFDTPPRRRIELHIDADRAIDIFIVRASDIGRWRARAEYEGTSYLRRKQLDTKLIFDPDFEDEWYLVFDNPSENQVAVQYDVYGL